jgi:putative heme-binding domain-containing protein
VTGGWRIQTGLYRVTYTGKESTTPAQPKDRGAKLRALRLKLEGFHGHPDPQAVKTVWPYLGHADRYLRFAARVALEWQDPGEWRERALQETKPASALTALLALVRVSARDQFHRQPTDRMPDPTLQGRVLTALDRIEWRKLTDAQRVELMRVYAVTFTRLGKPDETNCTRLIAKFDQLFPAATRELNAELCSMLAYLQSPSIAAKALALVDRAPTQEEQIEYIKALRVVQSGWTPELRETYFKWFVKAGGYRGGASFAGFMKLIKKDAGATLSEAEQAQLQPILDAQPVAQSPLQALQQGLPGHSFVKEWTVNELAPLAEHGLWNREFERGRKLFGALGCFACHRFANEGGAVGPDLTGAGGRFSPRDLLESIIEPSKTVSDLYAPIVITLNDGETLTGQIVYLGTDTVQVSTDMLNPGKTTKVDRNQIKSIEPSKVSPMPAGLLNQLQSDEIMDLLAYVISGGKPDNRMFGPAATGHPRGRGKAK